MQIARLLAPASVLALFAPPTVSQCKAWTPGFGPTQLGTDGTVRALEAADLGGGKLLYVGGAFTRAGFQMTGSVAAWGNSGWAGFGAGTADVFALEVHDDGSGRSLFVAGNFSQIGGVATNGVARWDGSNWHAVGTAGITSTVRALLSIDFGTGPVLIAGGDFSSADGAPAAHVAQWDGASWTPLGAGTDQPIHALESHLEPTGNFLYVGGAFDMAGGAPASRIARWNGASWSSLPGQLTGGGGEVHSLLSTDLGGGPVLAVGGSFLVANGVQADGIATWDGAAWSGIPLSPNPTVRDLAMFDEGSGPELYAAGEFDDPGNPAHVNAARWNGTSWDYLGGGPSGGAAADSVLALASFVDSQGLGLWVGGGLQSAGGIPSAHIGRWGVDCGQPTIVTQPPVVVVAQFEGNKPLTIGFTATGANPLVYQWIRDGVQIHDGGNLSGTDTNTLTIWPWSTHDVGDYSCFVQDGVSAVWTDSSSLIVPSIGVSAAPWPLELFSNPPTQAAGLPPLSVVERISAPRTTPQGSAAMTGQLNHVPASSAVLHWNGSTLSGVAWGGGPIPGLPITITAVNPAVHFEIAGAESVAVQTKIEGPSISSVNDEVLLYRDETAIDRAAWEGEIVPGFPTGSTWSGFGAMRLSATGKLFFRGSTDVSGSADRIGLFSWKRGVGAEVELDVLQPAPGTAGATITALEQGFEVDDSDRWAIVGRIDQTSGSYPGGNTDSVLWVGDSTQVVAAARSGEPAPGFPVGSYLEDFLNLGMRFDGSGRAVFASRVVEFGGAITWALFRWSPAGLERLVSEGEAVPGAPAGSTFLKPRPAAVNSLGDVVFFAGISSPCPSTCPERGVFLRNTQGVVPVLFDDLPTLPGLPPAYTPGLLESADINGAGQVSVQLRVEGGTGLTRAAYGWTIEGGLFPIIVPGLQIDRNGSGEFLTVIDHHEPARSLYEDSYAASLISDDGRVWHSFATWDPAGTGTYLEDFLDYEALWNGPGLSICPGDAAWGGCPCGNPGGTGEGCQNSTGAGAVLRSSGSRSVSADDATFRCTQMPPFKVALLIQGSSASAGLPFQDGRICVGGTVRRLRLASATGHGIADFGAGLAAKGNWSPGQTLVFQGWYRDGQGPCQKGANLTQALAVTFSP